jgi:NAD(P)-dependent dehydrogenase (short-subunit alcohol dehydrogenase family)
MKDLKRKVAVITGGASGIGLAFARRCLKEGMRLVLADIDKSALVRVEQELKAENATVITVPVDVSKAEDVENLCNKTYEQFGSTDILFNNAGVGGMGLAHVVPLSDWKWNIGVNLFGVIHGIHYFVPRMIKQDTEGYVLNTASIVGLALTHLEAPYSVTKASVVMLTETLQLGFQEINTKLHASVICPGFITTNIMQAEDHRPADLKNPATEAMTPEQEAGIKMIQKLVASGTSPKEAVKIAFKDIPFPPHRTLQDMIEIGVFTNFLVTGMPVQECADLIFREAIEEKKFYILPNGRMRPYRESISKRAENTLAGKDPESTFKR